MPKLLYISVVRFPTEKAHGLQIAQNCEAFADAGYEVQLWVSDRHNISAMNAIQDPFQHYGVEANFTIARIPAIDLYPFIGSYPVLERIAFYVHVLTFCLVLILRLIKSKADVYYTRDEFVLLALSLVLPKEKLAFEVHQFRSSKQGAWLQKIIAKRAANIIAITPKLREDFITQHQAHPEQILVAHDGIRTARFENLPDQTEARRKIGWPQAAFIVGYMGRLHTMGMDKGVGLLVQALAPITEVSIALVGGPDNLAEELRQDWQKLEAAVGRFLYAGSVPPDDIPTYLAAFDVCAMPFPWNPHYAYYMSPLKLFEYMASGRAILATDLPSISDILKHEVNALIVQPGDSDILAEAVQKLKNDPMLCIELGKKARETVMAQYTWTHRAQAIRKHIERDIMPAKCGV
jgi:glycosyltransferase involved in cell wall biosynthesis